MTMASAIPDPNPTPVGLSSAEAEQCLVQNGYNELPSTTRRNTLAIALGVAREPMFLLLIVSATIYLILGDVREAAILASSLFVIFGITIFQERKTERALDALRDLSSPRELVIRDGNAPIFGMGQVVFSLLAGFVSLMATLLVFGFSLYHGYGEAEVRTLTFATLVITMVGLILVNRSRSQNFWRALRLPNRAVWRLLGEL